MSRWIGSRDVRAIHLGSDMLASGGAGDSNLVALWAESVLEAKGPVHLVDWADLPPEGLVVPVANMGSPLINQETLYHTDALTNVIAGMERLKGAPAVALAAIEGAGSNILIALIAAAASGLPLVDGDAMGRAFPYLQMTSWSLNHWPASPIIVADHMGNQTICRAVTDQWAEEISRAVTVAMGGSSYIAAYAGRRSELENISINRTISRALALGKSLQTNRDKVVSTLKEAILISGNLVEVIRGNSVHYASLVTDEGHSLLVSFWDQFEAVSEGGEIRAQMPDIITLLDASNREAIACTDLRYGLRVHLFHMPAPDIWYTARGDQCWRLALRKDR